MKPKTMIFMGVSIACALGASYMTSRLLAERTGNEQEMVSVLVARKNLSMGDPLKVPAELFESKEFARGSEPSNAVNDLEALKGRILKRGLRAGDHVTNEDLFGKDGAGVYDLIPPGYRALGISVNLAEIAGGFASLPLSRVDIINTVRRNSDKDSYAQVLLENVLVVAADSQDKRDAEGRAMPASVVTVAVKPEDAMKLRLAGSMGTLSLVLRRLNDPSRVGESKITAESVRNGELQGEDEAEAPVIATKAPEPKAAPKAVEPKQAEVAQEPESQGHRHVLSVREGDNTKQTEYLLDDDFEVFNPDVRRSELTRPSNQRATTRPTPATPKTPDEDDE